MFDLPKPKYSSFCISLVFMMGTIVGIFSGRTENVFAEILTSLVAVTVFHLTQSVTLKLTRNK